MTKNRLKMNDLLFQIVLWFLLVTSYYTQREIYVSFYFYLQETTSYNTTQYQG